MFLDEARAAVAHAEQAAGAGLGVSLVPASLQMLKRPGVAYRRLKPAGPALETVIAWHRERELPFVQALVRVASEVSRVRDRPISSPSRSRRRRSDI